MKSNFKELTTLSELFNNKLFVIPDYQRGYSWEKDPQLNDLTSDIEKLSEVEHTHYTGTIVITLKQDEKNTYYVVDGQQRLTSLIIALYSIYCSNPKKYSYIYEKYLITGGAGNEQLILSSEDTSTNQFIKEVILGQNNNSPTIKSQTLLLEAKSFFKKWIAENPSKIDSFLDIIENKLGFLIYSPVNNKEIGIMFEVINNRGKSLSELEKIKNFFIYYATIFDKHTLRKTINEKWNTILNNLSIAEISDSEDENSFLRNCYIVFYYASKTKSWYVYNEIKEKFLTQNLKPEEIEANIISMQSFVAFLERASKYYAYLEKGDYFNISYKGTNKVELARALKLLRCQHVKASILPLYIAVMDIYQNDSSKLLEMLDIIEKLNFRVYILPKVTNRADTYQGSLFWTSYLFFNQLNNPSVKIKWDNYNEFTDESKSYSDSFDKLKELLITFAKKFCKEKIFIQSLTTDSDENDDFYNWRGLKYFLANYEYKEKQKGDVKIDWDIEKILITREEAKKNTNNYLSIEHIWASKNRVDHAPENHSQKRRLGNFVLLGLGDNIQNQAMDISDKVSFMVEKNKKNDSDFNLIQVKQIESKYYKKAEQYVRQTLKYQKRTYNYYIDLSTHLNDLRESELIRFALERWAFKDEKLNSLIKIDSFEARRNKLNEYYFLK